MKCPTWGWPLCRSHVRFCILHWYIGSQVWTKSKGLYRWYWAWETEQSCRQAGIDYHGFSIFATKWLREKTSWLLQENNFQGTNISHIPPNMAFWVDDNFQELPVWWDMLIFLEGTVPTKLHPEVHSWKINESNLKMMVWFRWFSFSSSVSSGFMLIIQGVFWAILQQDTFIDFEVCELCKPCDACRQEDTGNWVCEITWAPLNTHLELGTMWFRPYKNRSSHKKTNKFCTSNIFQFFKFCWNLLKDNPKSNFAWHCNLHQFQRYEHFAEFFC